jgi:hypothetical protein
MATTDEFYTDAELLCATVQGSKHTIKVYFRFVHERNQGQGYFLKDANGKEIKANTNQLWERFPDALRTARSEVERLY